MINVVLLLLWCSSGAVTAMAMTPREVGRLAWVPTAVIFGPLWLAVATEQRGPR